MSNRQMCVEIGNKAKFPGLRTYHSTHTAELLKIVKLAATL